MFWRLASTFLCLPFPATRPCPSLPPASPHFKLSSFLFPPSNSRNEVPCAAKNRVLSLSLAVVYWRQVPGRFKCVNHSSFWGLVRFAASYILSNRTTAHINSNSFTPGADHFSSLATSAIVMASSTSSVDNQLANHSTWRIASSLPERDELPSVLCQPLTANPTSKEEPSEITISLRSRDSTKRLRTRKSIKRLPSYTPRPPNACLFFFTS